MTTTGDSLEGRTVMITGATSGIGRATAVALAGRGARIVLAVRDAVKGERVAAALPGATHLVEELDLGDLGSVRRFAAGFSEPVDVLVNNAGVSTQQLQRTVDGHEMQFGVNHLGHFLLTSLLLPQITGRVVTVASQAERMARPDLDDMDWRRRPFNGSRAYADSKIANLLFTLELDRRLSGSGSAVQALAAHPGLVVTAIYDHPAGHRPGVWNRLLPVVGQKPDAGALPVVLAVTGNLPGGTFTGPRHLMHMRGGAMVIGRSARAKDAELAARLWALSEEMTDVRGG